MELTIPFQMNIKDGHNRKMERYGSLVADLRSVGYKVNLSCVEISSRGLITNDNKIRIKIFKFVGCKALQSFFRDVAKDVLLCSYALWNCKHDPKWVECPYIKVQGEFCSFYPLPAISIPLWWLTSAVPLCLVLFFILFLLYVNYIFCILSYFMYFLYVQLRATRVLGFHVPALFILFVCLFE